MIFVNESAPELIDESVSAMVPLRAHQKSESRCSNCANVPPLKDLEIGDGCVVAAGAVVTRSFPSGSVIAGVPARLLSAENASV